MNWKREIVLSCTLLAGMAACREVADVRFLRRNDDPSGLLVDQPASKLGQPRFLR